MNFTNRQIHNLFAQLDFDSCTNGFCFAIILNLPYLIFFGSKQSQN